MTVRVDRHQLTLGGVEHLGVVQGLRPQVGLIDAEEGGCGVAVAAVGDPVDGDPALGGLGVDAAGVGELVHGGAALQERGAQPFVRHSSPGAGTDRPERDVPGRITPYSGRL
jgi:hypothetical protein